MDAGVFCFLGDSWEKESICWSLASKGGIPDSIWGGMESILLRLESK
ncbi:hypothetical protein LIT32_01980 [Bacillus sp. CMF21]|jgi:hypothetical protein|nr:hypothetical protein MGI18_02885 [Bacillus sp. OVS6]USK28943.1 hypothetical protein LIT32_01980 [Bacillus sp. CMF21]